jgi:hypothetical protein
MPLESPIFPVLLLRFSFRQLYLFPVAYVIVPAWQIGAITAIHEARIRAAALATELSKG